MSENRGHIPFADELQVDWLLVLLGPFDPARGCRTGGLVQNVERLVEFMAFSRRIDSWLLRLLAGIVALKFVGIEYLSDIVKLFVGAH